MKNKIQIIDLFSGPGGLGEGFSGCRKNSPFEIAMSVESDVNAHKTLKHRAFFRRLPPAGKKMMYEYFMTGCQIKLLAIRKRYKQDWDRAEIETMFRPRKMGNHVAWDKLKAGKKINPGDQKDTVDQMAISSRIKAIKKQCKAGGTPLIVIGGPPCQAYSVNGRNRVNAVKNYSPDEDQRVFLYQEYCRVLAEAEPDAFVMENVQGILSARLSDGEKIFPKILNSLTKPYTVKKKKTGKGYRLYSFTQAPDESDRNKNPQYNNLSSYNIKAHEFGVPQTRSRIIVLGIREDHGHIDEFLQPADTGQATIADMIDTMPRLRSGISVREARHVEDSYRRWRKQWEDSIKKLSRKVDDSAVVSELKKAREKHIAAELDRGSTKLIRSKTSGFSRDFEKVAEQNSKLRELKDWILSDIKGFMNHSTKSHMTHDRMIYMYAAAYAAAYKNRANPSPKSKDFPGFLAPEHKNWGTGNYVDRFRCIEAGKVAKTITSHLKKDGHAFIHYDITQNRCLTPREAARIQTFPDDYFFEGSQGSQYQQIGNAVPPFLAKQLALHLLKIFKHKGIWK